MKKRSRTRRQGVPWKRVVVALLLGALISILVAWGIVLRSPGVQGYLVSPDQWHGDSHATAMTYDVAFPAEAPVKWGEDIDGNAFRIVGTGFFQMHHEAWISGPGFVEAGVMEAGFPLRALRSRVFLEMEDGVVTDAGVIEYRNSVVRPRGQFLPTWLVAGPPIKHIPEPLFNRGAKGTWLEGVSEGLYEDRRLPLVPMPLGFAINSLFYSTPFLLLFTVIPALRRFLRRRRGLCAHCAYNRAGLSADKACPECGTAR